MEVTTVSPLFTSPTNGPGECETDVTNVAIHSVTLLICLCGLAGNGAVLCLLSLKIRNTGIFDVTLADTIFLLFMVPSEILFLVEDLSCSPIVPLMYLSFLFQLSVVCYFRGLFRLMVSTNVVDKYKLWKLCCCFDLPTRLWWLVWRAQYWVFFAFLTVIPALTFLCLSHEQEHCRAAVMSMYAVIMLIFAAPVLITYPIDIIKAKRSSWQQQPQRRLIVIFIIVIFTLLLGFCNFLQQLGYISVPTQVVFLLSCIHSSIKPFIYFLAGRCWSPCSVGSLQLSLQRVFEGKKEKSTCRNDVPRDTVI